MRKPGTIEPVIYFVRQDGYHMLAPSSDTPCPDDCRKEFADTLKAVDKLYAILCKQEHEESLLMMQNDMAYREPRERAIRDRLYQRIADSSTSEYEKEFIRLYMQLRDERKKETYRQRYLEHQWVLYARENDLGTRRADEEKFDWQKHEVK